MLINNFPKCEVDFHFFAGLQRSTEQLQENPFQFRKSALVCSKKIFPEYFWFASEGICKKLSTEHL